jgi:hypothetical protein
MRRVWIRSTWERGRAEVGWVVGGEGVEARVKGVKLEHLRRVG